MKTFRRWPISMKTTTCLHISIDGGLWQGAPGVASTIRYLPGATVREIFEVQRLEARNGGLAIAHTR